VIGQGLIGSRVHQALIETGQLDLVQGPPDEIRVKGRKIIAWMGLAMMVSTRLWRGGTVRMSRDKGLADALMRASCIERPSDFTPYWC
jgi:hypothetical protein